MYVYEWRFSFLSHAHAYIRFRLWVYIITYNRLASLKRLCSSLLAAQYFGDNVNVWFRVDVPKGEGPHEGIMEFIHNFRWPHGQKHISTRFRNVRAMPASLSLCVCLSVCLTHTGCRLSLYYSRLAW